MKLRSPLFRPQILFAAGCALLLAFQASADAQAVRFKIRGGALQEGTFLGTDATGVKLKVAGRDLSLPPAMFESFEMPAPDDYAVGARAFVNRDYPTALAKIKSVVDKFKGLPTVWAQYATGLLGDIYLALDDLPKAEAAFNDAKRLYPSAGGGSAVAEIGPARILIKQRKFGEAKAKIDPITSEALQQKAVPPAKQMAYSQAFVASGQIKEAEENFSGALEDYLRTITIFYHDPAAVALAQEHAETLRARSKDHPITVP
jgi:tetratricopeptide (TPR) repeat protein